MRAVTIKDAKAHLNELIDAATSGEEVVLMRGSKHVAAIVPITAAQLELASDLGDAQAERFWARLAEERPPIFASPEAATAHLKKRPAKRKR